MFSSHHYFYSKVPCPRLKIENGKCGFLNCLFDHAIGKTIQREDEVNVIEYRLVGNKRLNEDSNDNRNSKKKNDDYFDNMEEVNFDGFIYNEDAEYVQSSPKLNIAKPKIDTSKVFAPRKRPSIPRKRSSVPVLEHIVARSIDGDVLLLTPHECDGSPAANKNERLKYITKIAKFLAENKTVHPKQTAMDHEKQIAEKVESFKYVETMEKFLKYLAKDDVDGFFLELEEELERDEVASMKRARNRAKEEEERNLLALEEAEAEEAERLARDKEENEARDDSNLFNDNGAVEENNYDDFDDDGGYDDYEDHNNGHVEEVVEISPPLEAYHNSRSNPQTHSRSERSSVHTDSVQAISDDDFVDAKETPSSATKYTSPSPLSLPKVKDSPMLLIKPSKAISIKTKERKKLATKLVEILKKRKDPTPFKSASEKELEVANKSTDATYADNMNEYINSFSEPERPIHKHAGWGTPKENWSNVSATSVRDPPKNNSFNETNVEGDQSKQDIRITEPLGATNIRIDRADRLEFIREIAKLLRQKGHETANKDALKKEQEIALGCTDNTYYQEIDDYILSLDTTTTEFLTEAEVGARASLKPPDTDLPMILVRGVVDSVSREERTDYVKSISILFKALRETMPNRKATDKEIEIATASNASTYHNNIRKFMSSLQPKESTASNHTLVEHPKESTTIVPRPIATFTIERSERIDYIKQISTSIAKLNEPTPNKTAINLEFPIAQKSNDNTYYDNVEAFIELIRKGGDYNNFVKNLKDTSVRPPPIQATKASELEKDLPMCLPKSASTITIGKQSRVSNMKKISTIYKSKGDHIPNRHAVEKELQIALNSTDYTYQSNIDEYISQIFGSSASSVSANPSPQKESEPELKEKTGPVKRETSSPISMPRGASKSQLPPADIPFITPRHVENFSIGRNIRINLIEKIATALKATGEEFPIKSACAKEHMIALNNTEEQYVKKIEECVRQIDPKTKIKDSPMALPKLVKPNPPADMKARKAFIQQLIAAYKQKRPDIFTPVKEACAKEYEIASTTSTHTYPQTIKKYIFNTLKGRVAEAKPAKKLVDTEEELYEKLNKIVIPVNVLQKFQYFTDIPKPEHVENYEPTIRDCLRCGAKFRLQDQLKNVECSFHPGKQLLLNKYNAQDYNKKVYDCCGSTVTDSPGCTRCKYHVFKWTYGFEMHSSIPFKKISDQPEKASAYKALGIDCEMGFTTKGFEVLRVTVVDFFTREEVFDTIVKPLGEVLDLNTTYSGISEIGEGALPFKDMIEVLYGIIDRNTILIGHGFENDMNVLRLIHNRIVDTSILYPKNQVTVNRKWSLRDLSFKYLSREIQTGQHDSTEDALAAIDVIRYHLSNNL